LPLFVCEFARRSGEGIVMTMTGIVRRAVLGIDAAWTEAEPGGIALAVETESGWTIAAVDASYGQFFDRANCVPPGQDRPRGAKPVAAELLDAALKICGRAVDLVAVDMPMARHPIVGRRPCDTKISSCYGARKAATHSPSAERPGKISDALRAEFDALGYRLCTAPPARGLIEVYPHPALIEFLGERRRLEYKAGKIGRYWPGLSPHERHLKLRTVWARIVEALESRIAGVRSALPPPEADVRGWRLKAYEDKLDAVVCAAVAVAALDGRARRFGDNDAAIWAPLGHAAQ
jgi:predicted RNase H-like nuclease